MSAQITRGLCLEVGQLHESMRQRGCEHLFAVFEVSALAPGVKHAVAENVPEQFAALFAIAPNLLDALRSAVSALEYELGEDHPRARQFDALIAKATGSTT